MTEFKVPELGENVAGGDVMRVMVNVGDTIARDQPVLELETDKATIEVPSSVAGIVKEVRVKKGDKVQVGAVILTVDDAAAGNGAGAAPAAGTAAAAGKPEPKAEAKPAEQAAPPPADKAEAPSTSLGAGKPVADHKVLPMPPRNAEPAARNPEPAPRADAPPQVPAARSERGPVAPASPAVRRLASEIGIVVDAGQGRGPRGRSSPE